MSAITGLTVLLVFLAAGAWACVPQPLILIQPTASGPPGAQVTVEGLSIPGSVEVRWNGVDGPRLATADGPHFFAPITIPQEPDGLYTVMVLARGADGSVGSTGRAAFLVTSGGGAAAQAPPTSVPSSHAPASNRTSTSTAVLLAEGAVIMLIGGVTGLGLASRRQRLKARAQPAPIP